MTANHLIAFAAFAVAAAATPGPSNALLTATGAQLGLVRGLPALAGASVGMATLMFVVMLGLGSIILGTPLLLVVVKALGAAVLLWLAWRIARAGPHQSAGGRALGFRAMTAFQWVNPKGWVVCASAAAAFIDPQAGSAIAQSATLASIFALLTLPSFFPWLATGALLQRALGSERIARRFNLAMGVLLAASVLLLVL